MGDFSGHNNDGKALTVSRNISLNGDIASCDALFVDGKVEATFSNGRSLEVRETGQFRGTAIVDDATIAGQFEGDLTVRDRLNLKPTGKIKGTVTCGTLVIELGGELTGGLSVGHETSAPENSAQ